MASKASLRSMGTKVRNRRESFLKMSRPDFAALVGISLSQLTHIELGNNAPSLPVYGKICVALGLGKPPLME